MSDCLFCSIGAGDIPSTKVYEDEMTLAFLDITPLAKGHTLVIAKKHAAKLGQLPSEWAAAVMRATQRIVDPLCKAAACPDATIAIHDGPAAGQQVGHLHVHVVPRKEGDGGGPVHALFDAPRLMDAAQLAEFAATVEVA